MKAERGFKIILTGLFLFWSSPVQAQQGFSSFADLAEKLSAVGSYF